MLPNRKRRIEEASDCSWVQNTALIQFHDCCLEEIRKHKWIESEKAMRDIGWAAAERDWYRRYASAFQHDYISNR